jgi:uncharacterized protein (DUF169 family)
MASFNSIAHKLVDVLQLAHAPVAITFTDAVPKGVKTFTGTVPAGCRFWQEATTQVLATMPADHEFCSTGMYTHNLEIGPAAPTDLQDALKVFGDLGYVREQDVARIPVLNRQPRVVYGPLASMPLPQDVVVLFVKPHQALIISEASQQLESRWPPTMGRPACGVVRQAFNTGRAALSLGCCGARAYLDFLPPDVALYAVPGSQLEAFAERVAALAKANSTLTMFHALRRRVQAGERTTVWQSLAAMPVMSAHDPD